MMKSSMKRIVLTGAAVAVIMSFAAPAMALPKVVDGGPGVIGPHEFVQETHQTHTDASSHHSMLPEEGECPRESAFPRGTPRPSP